MTSSRASSRNLLLSCTALLLVLCPVLVLSAQCECPVEAASSVEGCCCDTATINDQVADTLTILQELVQSTYFRHYRVKLDEECPFWPEYGLCASRECAVQCEEELDGIIPDTLLKRDAHDCSSCVRKYEEQCSPYEVFNMEFGQVTRTDHALRWGEENDDNVWHALKDGREEYAYVDLIANPERYTAYQGQHIWRAIYDENCGADRDSCLETKVFYRLISGLHSSVNSHLSYKYFHNGVWGPNATVYQEKVGAYQERIDNLYFAYMFVLRAVVRAREFFETHQYELANATEVEWIQQQMKSYFEHELLTKCPKTFDETQLFQGPNRHLRNELRSVFRNISRIMDCVGCERCRLWGGLQVLGLGTALKLMFCGDGVVETCASLQRTEIVALLNLLKNLAQSISYYQQLRAMGSQSAAKNYMMQPKVIVPTALIVVAFLCLTVWTAYRQKQSGNAKPKQQ